jgi:hypothetical protein
MWMGGIMKHLTYLSIAAGVFIFTKLYADAISFNSIEVSGINLVEQLFIISFITQWVAYIPAAIDKYVKCFIIPPIHMPVRHFEYLTNP